MLRLSPFDRLLYSFVAFGVLLIGIRITYTGSWQFVFLVVNLFLAWIPYCISHYFAKPPRVWQQWALLGTWLLFLPNAFYIVTDLIHLRRPSAAPVWLDALIILTAALAGLIMALVSLYRAEKWLLRRLKAWRVNLVIAAVLLASGFGVYLGRFLRWYSWDVVTKPGALLSSVAERIFFPYQHLRTWAFSVLMATFFALLYLLAKKWQQAAPLK
jgi:uncharacterized membrane protein